jgi:hypothetical protein
MRIGKGRYGNSITKAGERSCVYEIDMRRGKGAHTISGAAGLSGGATYLQTMPSAAAFPWVLAKSLWQLRPRWQTSPTHFTSSIGIVKNSIPQSLASLLLLSILLSIRGRLLCLRHLHCRRPSGRRGPLSREGLAYLKHPASRTVSGVCYFGRSESVTSFSG